MEKRLDWIDIAKGAAIILVVFAHTLVPQIRESGTAAAFIWIFIYNLHMPLFFFLSGWLFERGLGGHASKVRFILDKARLLLVPYLTLSAFAYIFINLALRADVFARVLESGGYTSVPPSDALFQIMTYSGHADQHLWFVYSLFIVFTVNILFPKITKSLPAVAVFTALYLSKAFIHYPGILNYTAGDLVFFSLARLLRSESSEVNGISARGLVICAAVFVCTNCVYSYFYITDMPDGTVRAALYMIRIICSVSGIITVCGCARLLQTVKISAFFKYLGSYSYDIYLLHAPFLVSGLMGISLAYTSVPAPVACALVLAAGIILPLLASKFIIRKIPPLSLLILGSLPVKKTSSAAKYADL